MYQQVFDFNVVHRRENNPVSQEILEDNKSRLNEACKVVHNLLLQGHRLNADNFKAITGYNEYRRRFKDLIDAGYPVKAVSYKSGMKEWYYEESYRNNINKK